MDGGAVGVIGDTRNSNTWSNNAFLRGLIDATWQGHVPGFGTDSIDRLGDILNYAKLYTLSQIGVAGTTPDVGTSYAFDTLNLYHVFGDPTLEMWTSNPYDLDLASLYKLLDLDSRQLVVEYPLPGAILTAYQLRDGQPVPLGRGTVPEGGMLTLPLIADADTQHPVMLAICAPNSRCAPLDPVLPGDLDQDLDVDTLDLLTFLANFTGSLEPGTGGRSFLEGDLDGDADIDTGDLLALIAAWTGSQNAEQQRRALAGPQFAPAVDQSEWAESDTLSATLTSAEDANSASAKTLAAAALDPVIRNPLG
jgi:hypothetical protein